MQKYNYDDSDDAPSRFELESERAESEATDKLLAEWDDTREGMALARAEGEHPHLNKIIDMLYALRDAFIAQGLPEMLAHEADAAAEARDPHGYRGLSQSMFM